MANPFSILNKQSPMGAFQGSIGNIQSLYRAVMGAKNPMQAFQRIASQNPYMQPILQALQGGANPQQLFASLCQQRGINPQEFMRQITNNNGF